jgi:CBS domain-containing protein
MRIADIMSDNVDIVSPSDPVDLAEELMKRQQIHHVVVVENGAVVGVVSACDLERCSPDVAARAVMSTAVATVSPDTTIRDAANLLRGRSIGCLPVVSAGRLVGIVTGSDLRARGAATGPAADRSWHPAPAR